MITSYRRLMATTRAVLRDAATMVRRIGQRLGTAAARRAPMLARATQLQTHAPAGAADPRRRRGRGCSAAIPTWPTK